MKTKTLLLIAAFLFTGVSAQAQFWKKLTKKAEQAAERAVIRKTEQKVSKETEKAFDKMLDMDLGQKAEKVDPATFQKTYRYDWRYTLEMKHKKGNMRINYHLREQGTDFGSTFEMQKGTQLIEGMVMVMDEAEGITAILMNQNGKKVGQIMDNPTDKVVEIATKDNPLSDAEFKEIGTKKILGYECQGFQVENDDIKMTVYVAFNTPVSLNKASQGSMSKQLPKGFDSKWLDKFGDNSLMMEMDMVNKKKAKQSATMTCVSLEKEPMNINLSDYDFSMQKALEKRVSN